MFGSAHTYIGSAHKYTCTICFNHCSTPHCFVRTRMHYVKVTMNVDKTQAQLWRPHHPGPSALPSALPSTLAYANDLTPVDRVGSEGLPSPCRREKATTGRTWPNTSGSIASPPPTAKYWHRCSVKNMVLKLFLHLYDARALHSEASLDLTRKSIVCHMRRQHCHSFFDTGVRPATGDRPAS